MPSISRRICNKHGIYESNRCPKCKQTSNKTYDTTARDQSQKKVYNSKRWNTARKNVIINALFKCALCGDTVGVKPKDHAVDHIKEIRDGGSKYEYNNLQLLCTYCHGRKTAKEVRAREGR